MAAIPRNQDLIRELFDRALERPAGERVAFVDEACRGNVDLRAELTSLLKLHEEAGSALRDPSGPVSEQPGERIGHYRLLQRIGEGGFGTVWMAEQQEPVRRKVALKVLKAGMDTAQVVARFEAERQALALMDHPHIAQVFDGGSTPGGRPYFVMELVRGVPITRYCDEAGLSPRERLELFIPVCQAVQHAHFKGVIHRDIKPTNVLVTLHDGRPVPKVIDFGIAKAVQGRLTERTLFTEFQQMLGTPEYMAPEQAEMSALDVDTRADVYSLGVLLYELLTGTRPFDFRTLLEVGYAEVLRTIKEVDPPKPSTRVSTLGEQLASVAKQRRMHPRALGPLMRGDLDWIVMRTLEKERNRRYATPAALAEDVQRYLRDEPVEAGPPSRLYRLRKYVQRHRLGVGSGAAIALAVCAGSAAAGWGWLRASDEAHGARTSATHAGRMVALLDELLGSADPHAQKGPEYSVRQLLEDFERELGAELMGEPEVESGLRATLAGSYIGLGLAESARAHTERAKALRLELFGEKSPEHADSLMLEVGWMHLEGRYAEALPVCAEAVALVRRLGPDHLRLLAEGLLTLGDLHWHVQEGAEADAAYQEVLQLARELDASWATTALDRLGVLYTSQGRFVEAEATLRQVIERRRADGEVESLDLAGSLSKLASVLVEQYELDEALALAEEAVRISRAAGGERHPSVASHLSTLGSVLLACEEFERAARLFEEAAELQRERLGEQSPQRAESLRCMATAEILLGRLAEAERHARQALEIDLSAAGEDSAAVAEDRRVLCRVLVMTRSLDEAEQQAGSALATYRRIHGERHPQVALVLIELAQVLQHLAGRHDEAVALLDEALDTFVEAGSGHEPRVTEVQFALASVHLDAGRPREAEPFAVAALGGRRERYPEDSQYVVDGLLLLARIRQALGDQAQAQELAQEALGQQQASGGDATPLKARSLGQQARMQLSKGDAAGAEKSLRAALEIQEQLLPPDHLDLATTWNDFGLVYEVQGRLDEAEAALERSLEVYRSSLGDTHAWIAITIASLAKVQLNRGDFAASERLYREALEMHERLPDKRALSLAVCWHGIGDAQRLAGDMAGAAGPLRTALELRREALGPGHPDLANNLNTLGFVLLELGELADAEACLRETLDIRQAQGADWAAQWPTKINLGLTLERAGRAGEAEALYRGELEIVRGAEAHPLDLANVCAQLAENLLAQDRPAEAEPLLAECLALRAKHIPDDWRRYVAMSLLGEALLAQEKTAEAEPKLIEAAQKLHPPPGLASRRRDAIERLIALYEATQRPDDAATWRKALDELAGAR